MNHHKPLATGIRRAGLAALIAGGVGLSANALGAPQGLYSADELMDADVYASEDPSQEIGEVEDILLDDDMRVRGIVIETGGLLDRDKRDIVLETGQFSVETRDGDDLDDLEYRVLVELSEEDIAERPEYTNDWWSRAREGAREAWEETQEGASSAWETTQEGASSAMDRVGQALERVGQEAQDAADR